MSSTNVCYGMLTGSLLLAYLASVAVLPGLVRALTGQESDLAIIMAIVVIAAHLNPVRGVSRRLSTRAPVVAGSAGSAAGRRGRR